MNRPRRATVLRHRILALATTAVLAGCNSSGHSSYVQYAKMVGQAVNASFNNGSITREQAAKITYASMGYRIDGGSQRIIVLATDTAGELLWTASDHIVLITRDGRLRRSVGLPRDVGGTSTTGSIPAPAAAISAPFTYVRQQDFPGVGLYSLAIECRAVSRGNASIAILGAAIPVIRIDESCRAKSNNWAFTDTYWVDPASGLSWKSLQHIDPGGGTIETEIFRPPS